MSFCVCAWSKLELQVWKFPKFHMFQTFLNTDSSSYSLKTKVLNFSFHFSKVLCNKRLSYCLNYTLLLQLKQLKSRVQTSQQTCLGKTGTICCLLAIQWNWPNVSKTWEKYGWSNMDNIVNASNINTHTKGHSCKFYLHNALWQTPLLESLVLNFSRLWWGSQKLARILQGDTVCISNTIQRSCMQIHPTSKIGKQLSRGSLSVSWANLPWDTEYLHVNSHSTQL